MLTRAFAVIFALLLACASAQAHVRAAPAIGTTEYRYNTASQLIERTGQGGFSSVSSYDLAGRVKTIQHRVGGSPTLTLEYDYDRNGNRAEQRLTHAGKGLERTVYRYDDADRLTRSTRTPPAGNALETTWTLDEVGNRTLEEVRELGSLTQRTAYTYDLRDRLQTATPELPTGPPTAYQYDADGNVSSEQIGSTAPTQYRWDARDRLAEYTPAGAPAIRNRYDESDRRIAREDAATGSRYRWDGNALLEETNALGNRLTRYHRGIGLIGATSAATQPDPRQYARDAQDTPLALIRPDGGIAGRATFDIWGKAAWQSGEQSKLGFTGYQKETGDLYQAVARYYRPGTGSFLSTDPWEGDYNNPVSLNKYLYGYGNPGIFVDPDGRTGFLTWASGQFDESDRILRQFAEDTPYVGGAVGLVRGAMSLASVPTRALNTTSDAVAQALPFEATSGVSAEGSMGLGQVVDPTVYAAKHPGQTANAVYGNVVDTTSRTFFDGDGAAASDFTSGIVQMAPTPSITQGAFSAGAKVAKQLVEKSGDIGVGLRSFDNFDGNIGAGIADDLRDFDNAGIRGIDVGSTDQFKMETGGSIGDQGLRYEKFVGQSMEAQDKLPNNFKTFDYFNQSTGVATSVKTINTTLPSKVANPKKIYDTMRRDINKAANFNKPYTLLGYTLDPSTITSRVVKVAVPRATTSAQWDQIMRAIDYGREVGVKVEVETVDIK